MALGMRSWVDSANDPEGDFPLENLPFGVFRRDGPASIAVAIGDRVLDLRASARLGLLAFFAAMTIGSALLEFDLGSAGRHKLLYLPMLFPFAAEEALRLWGRDEPA